MAETKVTLTEIAEIARTAVACKHWRWHDGMAAWTVDAASGEVYGDVVRVLGQPWRAEGQSERVRVVVDLGLFMPPSLGTAFTSTLLPDLTDAATVGCLLALVREVWGDGTISTYYDAGGHWCVFIDQPVAPQAPTYGWPLEFGHFSEGAALALAFAAAHWGVPKDGDGD